MDSAQPEPDGAEEGPGAEQTQTPPQTQPQAQGRRGVAGLLLGLLGGAIGGFLGWWLFFAIARQGFYAIILPGVLIGIGCGALSGRQSNLLGILCGVAGLIVGLLTEWRFAPFRADRSLVYFLTHLHNLRTVTLALIPIGAFLAFWFGRGREGYTWLRRRPTSGTTRGAD